MGQQVQAIVYGVYQSKVKKLGKLFGSNNDLINPPPGHIETGQGMRQVIGIAICVDRVFDDGDGEIDFPECTVFELERKIAKQINGARKRWDVLAEWAKSLGVYLGVPDLLLVPVERA